MASKLETDGDPTVKKFLEIERLSDTTFRGKNLWMAKWMRAVYGGQIMGQALMSAWMCVESLDSNFVLHSFHCYFVGPMQRTPDVTYRVTRVKDGNNFCSMSVVAVQNSRVCFHCLVSFQKPVPFKVELGHSNHPMPSVPHPEDPAVLIDLTKEEVFATDDHKTALMFIIPPGRFTGKFVFKGWPLKVYDCEDIATAKKQFAKEPTEPKKKYWLKEISAYDESDSQNLHRIALAYSTDITLSATILYSYPNFKLSFTTSLDHSIWFHAPVHSGNWHLFVDNCENSSLDGCSLYSRRIYAEDGTLVATCMQQSLIRPKL